MAFSEAAGNQICQVCEEHEATHFCNCVHTPALLCVDCWFYHSAKPGLSPHRAIPIAALGRNFETYMHRYEAVAKATAAVRGNVERIEKFSTEFDDMMKASIRYLAEYHHLWLNRLQAEIKEIKAAIEAAEQETAICLDREMDPTGPLAQALWTLSPEELEVINCSVRPPDLQALCATWASYSNTLHRLCDRFPVPRDLLAYVHSEVVEIYDLQSQQSTKHVLPTVFDSGASYIQVDRRTLLCLGGDLTSTAVRELDLHSLQLASLPPMQTPRTHAGVAKVSRFVYIFGGSAISNIELKYCEKYTLQDKQSFPLGDMQWPRSHFTPCTFRTLIYLVSPWTTRTIETFHPEAETFTVLPISLPPEMELNSASTSFIVHGELCVLTTSEQIGRWRIERDREFRLCASEKWCCSSQPPLITQSTVLIANCTGWTTKLETFSLESYTFL